ncbi:hypothetical protein FEZ33_08425 [Ruoffia tabacinasalis]|uniref:Uncharacterized protein n=1 Tax=Ruoffia tabacinasalis TaxID=87458 RepID=A0A5R9DW44_9LACT|nr:hypothetical protein [Ruoffia tabacinasalis]TLQ40398.1 hypothetical protein FEZ33_08425 [Ruoffia tabacinasalis]
MKKYFSDTRSIAFLLMLIIFSSFLIWFLVQDSKPKTALELVDRMASEETIRDRFSEGADTEENVELLSNYRFNNITINVSQYFVMDVGDDNVLIVETTAGLIDNELYIEDLLEIDRETLEEFLNQ